MHTDEAGMYAAIGFVISYFAGWANRAWDSTVLFGLFCLFVYVGMIMISRAKPPAEKRNIYGEKIFDD